MSVDKEISMNRKLMSVASGILTFIFRSIIIVTIVYALEKIANKEWVAGILIYLSNIITIYLLLISKVMYEEYLTHIVMMSTSADELEEYNRYSSKNLRKYQDNPYRDLRKYRKTVNSLAKEMPILIFIPIVLGEFLCMYVPIATANKLHEDESVRYIDIRTRELRGDDGNIKLFFVGFLRMVLMYVAPIVLCRLYPNSSIIIVLVWVLAGVAYHNYFFKKEVKKFLYSDRRANMEALYKRDTREMPNIASLFKKMSNDFDEASKDEVG